MEPNHGGAMPKLAYIAHLWTGAAKQKTPLLARVEAAKAHKIAPWAQQRLLPPRNLFAFDVKALSSDLTISFRGFAMASLLSNFRNTMIVSALLALIMIAAFGKAAGFDGRFAEAVFRWMHVVFGIL